MSRVRKCDACGAIAEAPYLGWLRVETLASETDESGDRILLGTRRKPLLTFDICGPGCLGELALSQIEAMSEARLREAELQ